MDSDLVYGRSKLISGRGDLDVDVKLDSPKVGDNVDHIISIVIVGVKARSSIT